MQCRMEHHEEYPPPETPRIEIRERPPITELSNYYRNPDKRRLYGLWSYWR